MFSFTSGDVHFFVVFELIQLMRFTIRYSKPHPFQHNARIQSLNVIIANFSNANSFNEKTNKISQSLPLKASSKCITTLSSYRHLFDHYS